MKFLIDQDLKNVTLRKEQEECLERISEVLDENPQNKFFLLDLPTGVGKSILAIKFISNYLKTAPGARFDILTESKILQKQYTDEFNSISNLWGANTYECSEYSCSCEKGKKLAKLTNSSCENCPYEHAKEQFLNNKVSLTNFHMYTVLKISDIISKRPADVLIVDEAHGLESVISDYVSVIFSEANLKKCGYEAPEILLNKIYKANDLDSLYRIVKQDILNDFSTHVGNIDKILKSISSGGNKQYINRSMSIDTVLDQDNDIITNTKWLEESESLMAKIENFINEYEKDPQNWGFDKYKDDDDKIRCIIEPVWVYPFMHKLVWSRYEKVILMSGTFLNKEMPCFLNGIDIDKAWYYKIDSPFPIKNRPIFYMNTGKMSFKEKTNTFVKSSKILEKVLNKYKNKKGIIHTVNYELVEWIKNRINNKRLLYHDSTIESKNDILKYHYTEKVPSVIVSPSMMSGVDLKNSRARFQVLMKVPYPSLASDRNKKRMKSNSQWYGWATSVNIIQAYGRAIRNKEDYADFIVLDSCFEDVIRYSSKFFPKWVLDAIQYVDMNKVKV